MLRDVRTLEQGAVIRADVCVVGAGPAGLTLARELDGQGLRICVVESGGLKSNPFAQRLSALAETDSVIRPAPYNRRRQIGGNAHLWRVGRRPTRSLIRYLPFDAIDFERRSWVANSGWPFAGAALDRYYARAHELLGLGPVEYELDALIDADAKPFPLGDDIRTSVERFGTAAPFIDLSSIRRSRSITVLYNAAAGGMSLVDDGGAVESIPLSCNDGVRRSVRADVFVLAAGGIENPRLLLLPDERGSSALGQRLDAVGRYYMDHLHIAGSLAPLSSRLLTQSRLYDVRRLPDGRVVGCKLNLEAAAMRREEILNCALKFDPVMPSGIGAADTLARLALRHRQLVPSIYEWSELPAPERRFRDFSAYLQIELPPLSDNRVTLADDLDLFGRPLPRVRWSWDPLSLKTVKRAGEIFSHAFQASGLGALQMVEGNPPPLRHHEGLNHPMGTTRMHEDPRLGVVDANCRVHTTTNLYIAGSSVFPTGSYANPTLTIVALAARLAEHVLGTLQRARVVPNSASRA